MRALVGLASVALCVAGMSIAATVPPGAQPFPAPRPQPARHGGGRSLPDPTTAPGQSARRQRRLARHGKSV